MNGNGLSPGLHSAAGPASQAATVVELPAGSRAAVSIRGACGPGRAAARMAWDRVFARGLNGWVARRRPLHSILPTSEYCHEPSHSVHAGNNLVACNCRLGLH